MGRCVRCGQPMPGDVFGAVCSNCKRKEESERIRASQIEAQKNKQAAERERAEERAMDWRTYTDRFGNKVRVSGKTGDFQVKMFLWGWMGSSYKGNIEIRYPNGDLYVGGVHGSLFHGKGKMTWKKTGNSYEGDWVYDHQTGKGRFTWASGDYYEGDFVDGKRTGKGKYVWPNGCYYEGDFVDGNFNGYGIRVYSDGYRYEGQFKDDKRHGKGVLTSPDGTAVEYYYENDKIVRNIAESSAPTLPKATAKPIVEKKTTATIEVRKTETAVPVAKVVEESLEESSEQKIWNSLLKMSEKEKKAYFETHHELTVPAGTEVIPAKAFEFCLGLKKINFNDDIREIGEYAFYCTGIDSVLMIPKSVSKIRDHAFAMCHVEKIILPNNITVEEYAFAYIKALSEVTFETDLPQDVVFGKKVFARSDKHMTKEMIEKIKSIGSGAFK